MVGSKEQLSEKEMRVQENKSSNIDNNNVIANHWINGHDNCTKGVREDSLQNDIGGNGNITGCNKGRDLYKELCTLFKELEGKARDGDDKAKEESKDNDNINDKEIEEEEEEGCNDDNGECNVSNDINP